MSSPLNGSGWSTQCFSPPFILSLGMGTRRYFGLIDGSGTVAEALQGNQWIQDISGALTVQVLLEYLQTWDRVHNTTLLENQEDRICWKWTPDRNFSTASAYLAFFNGQHPIEGANVLRKTRAPGQCKCFIWLVIHDRCWTAARRKRHGLQDDDTCVLCAQSSETIDHLLTTCPFSREIWFNILRKLGWERMTPDMHTLNFPSWWLDARTLGSRCPRREEEVSIL